MPSVYKGRIPKVVLCGPEVRKRLRLIFRVSPPSTGELFDRADAYLWENHQGPHVPLKPAD